MSRPPSPRALLVHPRFNLHSFWNYHETCAAAGARYSAAPLGLTTVAALLPGDWTLRLVDRNIEELAVDDLEWADVVMIGAMLPQQNDAKKVIALAQGLGKPVVMGGPDVTCSPDIYDEVEYRVLGEAENVISQFISAWDAGKERGTFQAESYPDITTSPVPRFDLLKLNRYMHVGVQYSRGCPFNCEFCNVIELNGRVPRQKTPVQMLAELDYLHQLGYRGHVDFVDDNLIGAPKAVKLFLGHLGDWLARKNYPFEFSSEVSLNLADSDELLSLMQRAGFFAVFVGIETPDPATLASTDKKPNLKRNITESIGKIHRAGIFVNAGFIIGFDNEMVSVARGMSDCIEAASIPVSMVGLLYALPNTRLSRRLLAEGRLHAGHDRLDSCEHDADQCTSGLNYDTMRPRGEILRDYRTVLQEIYCPEAFFGRVRRLMRQLDLSHHVLRTPLRRFWRNLRAFGRISLKIGIRDGEVRWHYWRALASCLIHNPRAMRSAVSMAALYLHIRPFVRYMDTRLSEQIEGTGKKAAAMMG